MDVNSQWDGLRLADAGALHKLEAATLRCGNAMRHDQEQYQRLLEKYEALKSVNEGNHTPHNNIRHTEVGGHYIAVLVDAHSHRFKDELMHDAERGGGHTAELLKRAINNFITTIDPIELSFRLEVRVYADLKGLSAEVMQQPRQSHKPTIPRALGGFAAGFSSGGESFSFIDVVDEQIVESKIIDALRTCAEDSRCKHILFAASGSAEYVHVLQAHRTYFSKITIIQRDAVDSSLMYLGLCGVVFADLFSCVRDNGVNTVACSVSINTEDDTRLEEKRCNQQDRIGHASRKDATITTMYSSRPSLPISHLSTEGLRGLIPINAVGHRVDNAMRKPTATQWSLWEQYAVRSQQNRACHDFHLRSGCSNSYCKYDHSPMTPNLRCCLQYLVKIYPCKEQGACRRLDCSNGHACQNKSCENGKSRTCKFIRRLHNIDLRVVGWIKPCDGNSSDVDLKTSPRTRVEEARESLESWGTSVVNLIDL